MKGDEKEPAGLEGVTGGKQRAFSAQLKKAFQGQSDDLSEMLPR